MKLRSMLFVPADSERKLEKALASRPDALILDLEDAVAATRKPLARTMAAEFIGEQAARLSARLFVRVNPLDSGLTLADLADVAIPGLAGIVLPKANGAGDVVRLGLYLDALETARGLTVGSTRIVTVTTAYAGEFALHLCRGSGRGSSHRHSVRRFSRCSGSGRIVQDRPAAWVRWQDRHPSRSGGPDQPGLHAVRIGTGRRQKDRRRVCRATRAGHLEHQWGDA
jgi:hypothetical protein